MISNDDTNHYCWIKNISRLLSKQTSNRNGARFYCERCMNSFFWNKNSLEKHLEYCKKHNAVEITLPKKGVMLSFINYNHIMRVILNASQRIYLHVNPKKLR